MNHTIISLFVFALVLIFVFYGSKEAAKTSEKAFQKKCEPQCAKFGYEYWKHSGGCWCLKEGEPVFIGGG